LQASCNCGNITDIQYYVAEDNSIESGLQLLKRRRPRNALQLERPVMEAFNPVSTSERADREVALGGHYKNRG